MNEQEEHHHHSSQEDPPSSSEHDHQTVHGGHMHMGSEMGENDPEEHAGPIHGVGHGAENGMVMENTEASHSHSHADHAPAIGAGTHVGHEAHVDHSGP